MREKLERLFFAVLVILMLGGWFPLAMIYMYFNPPREFKSAREECYYHYKGNEAAKCLRDKRRIERMTPDELQAAYEDYLDQKRDDSYSR